MGRKIEVTQFTAEEFKQWAAVTPRPEFKKEEKTKAFMTFEASKQDLNGVIRVRVLKDAEKPETLEFTFERRRDYSTPKLLTEPLIKKESTPKPQRPREINKPISVVIPDVKARLLSELAKAEAKVKGVFQEGEEAIDSIIRGVTAADFSNSTEIAQLQSVIMLTFTVLGWDADEDEKVVQAKSAAFNHLFLALGLFIIAGRLRPLFDKGELQMLVNRLLRPKGHPPQKRPQQQKPSPTA